MTAAAALIAILKTATPEELQEIKVLLGWPSIQYVPMPYPAPFVSFPQPPCLPPSTPSPPPHWGDTKIWCHSSSYLSAPGAYTTPGAPR